VFTPITYKIFLLLSLFFFLVSITPQKKNIILILPCNQRYHLLFFLSRNLSFLFLFSHSTSISMEGHQFHHKNQRQHQQQQQNLHLHRNINNTINVVDVCDRFPQWSIQETKEFLMIRAELDQTFMETKRNKQLWEVISNHMKEKGYHRSAEQCKCKWKNLVTRYKVCSKFYSYISYFV